MFSNVSKLKKKLSFSFFLISFFFFFLLGGGRKTRSRRSDRSLVDPVRQFICILARSNEFFSSSMAALYEGYTLCGLVPDQNLSSSGIQGIEEERDRDHVVVTDSTRSVTLYKVTFKISFQEAPLTWAS